MLKFFYYFFAILAGLQVGLLILSPQNILVDITTAIILLGITFLLSKKLKK